MYVSGDGVLNPDPQQSSGLGVHRRLPELVRIHFSEPLVALDMRPSASIRKKPLERLAHCSDPMASVTLVHRSINQWRIQTPAQAYEVTILDRSKELAAKPAFGRDTVQNCLDSDPESVIRPPFDREAETILALCR